MGRSEAERAVVGDLIDGLRRYEPGQFGMVEDNADGCWVDIADVARALAEAGAIIPPPGDGPLVRWDWEKVTSAIDAELNQPGFRTDDAAALAVAIATALNVAEASPRDTQDR